MPHQASHKPRYEDLVAAENHDSDTGVLCCVLLQQCCETLVEIHVHCSYTVVTLLLHCCYTVVTPHRPLFPSLDEDAQTLLLPPLPSLSR
jgi:hypothetical protein